GRTVQAIGTSRACWAPETRQPPAAAGHPSQPRPATVQAVRQDRHGDDLPPGAVARVGSVRWWHGRDHEGPLVFTPDGKSLVCCDSGAVRLLDTTGGKEQRRLQHPNEKIDSFALSPDGKTLV